MEFLNKLIKDRGREVLAVMLSAEISLLIYFFYDVSIVDLFLLYYIQTLILIPVNVIRAFRFDLLRGLIDLFAGWPLLLVVCAGVVKSAIKYFGYDEIVIGEEYLLMGSVYLILGVIAALYGKKVNSVFKLDFLKSIIFRRTGIMLLSLLVSSFLVNFTSVTFAIVFFIIIQTIFELFILYQSLQFHKTSYQTFDKIELKF